MSLTIAGRGDLDAVPAHLWKRFDADRVQERIRPGRPRAADFRQRRCFRDTRIEKGTIGSEQMERGGPFDGRALRGRQLRVRVRVGNVGGPRRVDVPVAARQRQGGAETAQADAGRAVSLQREAGSTEVADIAGDAAVQTAFGVEDAKRVAAPVSDEDVAAAANFSRRAFSKSTSTAMSSSWVSKLVMQIRMVFFSLTG